MTRLLLSHLSKNNNSPELVDELFRREANGVHIVVASRYKETEVYQIAAGKNDHKINGQLVQPQKIVQASLF